MVGPPDRAGHDAHDPSAPAPGVHEEPIAGSQAIRTIHAALDAGVRVLDTAINYLHGRCRDGPERAVSSRGSRHVVGGRR